MNTQGGGLRVGPRARLVVEVLVLVLCLEPQTGAWLMIYPK